jgi:hypothetical protein
MATTTGVRGAELVHPAELILLTAPTYRGNEDWSWTRDSDARRFERVKDIERSPWLRAAAAVHAAARRGDPAPSLATASLREMA